MLYKIPHINKIYEALTAIADDRVSDRSTTTDLLWVETITAQVKSSSGDKTYTISYQPNNSLIISNDIVYQRNNTEMKWRIVCYIDLYLMTK